MSTVVRASPSPVGERRLAAERVVAANEASERFFASNAEQIARACQAMAARFQRGGRLLVHGDGPQRTDVSHIVVEFVHPVIVGKRALPALPLPLHTSQGDSSTFQVLDTLGRSGDIVMALEAGGMSELAGGLLAHARAKGMLTIALTGSAPVGGSLAASPDFHFAVPSHDPCIVQETHEMLYHMLWELVHVFFEHRSVTT